MKPVKGRIIEVPLGQLVESFYIRVALDQDRVIQFGVLYEAGENPPPIEVFELGKKNGAVLYGIVDGRHRKAGAEIAELKTLKVRVVEEKDRPSLIARAFRANYGGSKPPTEADILHTLDLFLDDGLSERQIYERMPLPKSVTRKYLKSAYSTRNSRKLAAASLAVSDERLSVPEAAKKFRVSAAKLSDLLRGRQKSGLKFGLEHMKGQLTQRYRSHSAKTGKLLQRVFENFKDDELQERIVQGVLAHLFKLVHQEDKNLRDWANRFAAAAEQKKRELEKAA